MQLPPAPTNIPEENSVTSTLELRFEDISQNGRLRATMVPLAVKALWAKIYEQKRIVDAAEQGILPILSRMKVWVSKHSFSLSKPLTSKAVYQLAYSESPTRLLLNMWATIHGETGKTYEKHTESKGEQVVAARFFAEHIFTRPFASAGNRKVTSLDGPWLPKTCYTLSSHQQSAMIPEGAQPLDSCFSQEPNPVVFGLMHTDSNQHVNSLEYPRMLEEAMVRRLSKSGTQGEPAQQRQAGYFEVAWRKPFLAGQIAELALQSFTLDSNPGAAATFSLKGKPDAQPHCFARIIMD